MVVWGAFLYFSLLFFGQGQMPLNIYFSIPKIPTPKPTYVFKADFVFARYQTDVAQYDWVFQNLNLSHIQSC
jgi:hypothetical protein